MGGLLLLAIDAVSVEGIFKLRLEELSDLSGLSNTFGGEEIDVRWVISFLVSSIQYLIIIFLHFLIKVDLYNWIKLVLR